MRRHEPGVDVTVYGGPKDGEVHRVRALNDPVTVSFRVPDEGAPAGGVDTVDLEGAMVDSPKPGERIEEVKIIPINALLPNGRHRYVAVWPFQKQFGGEAL